MAYYSANYFTDPAKASASSTYNTHYSTSAAAAIDNLGNPTWGWGSDTSGLPEWWQYDFGSGNAKRLNRYVVTGSIAGYEGLSPRDFLFQGSNNGVDWDTIDSRTSIVWTGSETKTFDFANNNSYRYYRLYVTAITSGSNTGIGHIEAMEYVPDVTQLSPSLQWLGIGSQQIFPELQWDAILRATKNTELQWQSSLYHKFVPNIVDYPFYLDDPIISQKIVPMTISGCMVGFSIYLENTGTSGNTTLKIYSKDTLKDTVIIAADNSSYSKVIYTDLNQMLNPGEEFKVEVLTVATGAIRLKVNMYLMTFPFEMEELFFANTLNEVLFTGINKDYLFQSSDYWTIDFNQPILSIDHVTFTDENGDIVDATYSLVDGAFFSNRLKINPYTNSVVKNIQIKIQDYNEEYHIFELKPKVSESFGDYPEYSSAVSSEFELYIAATGYRYSFDDGITWSNWSNVSNENTVSLDFSLEADGYKIVKIQYALGANILEDSFSLYYLSGDIDATLFWLEDYALLEYTDYIPLDKIEVYYDNVLSDTLSIPVLSGFDTFSVDGTNKELDISAGSIYLGAEKYDYDGSSWSLEGLDFEAYSYVTQYKVFFGFDTIENKFDVKIIANTNPSQGTYDERFPEFIIIWGTELLVTPFASDFSSYGIAGTSTPKYLFSEGKIQIDFNTSKDIKISVIDLAGRTRDFLHEFIKTKYNVWRTLTVTKVNVTANSEGDAGYTSDAAVDNITSTFWATNMLDSLPFWWQYEFGSDNKKAIVEVSIMARYADTNSLPTDFIIQASNDRETWTDLHTVIGEVWTNDGPKVYSFVNTTEFSFYRIYFTGSSSTYIHIKEIELRESIGGVDLTQFTESEVLPGEIHQSDELNISLSSEDWGTDPDGPTE